MPTGQLTGHRSASDDLCWPRLLSTDNRQLSTDGPVSCEDGRDIGVAFDAHQRLVERRAVALEMLAGSRPFGDDRGEQVERAQVVAVEVRPRGEDVGEHFPMTMQPRTRPGADALLQLLVAVRVLAPAFGIVDDADRRIAVGGDEDEPTNDLRAPGHLFRQQFAVGMRGAEMDEDRGAFGQRAAVILHERRNLPQRIDFEKIGIRVVLRPRRGFHDAKRLVRDDERRFDRGRSRSGLAIKRVHRTSVGLPLLSAGCAWNGRRKRYCQRPLRMSPTPIPSIANAVARGSTTIGSNAAFSGMRTISRPRLRKRLTVTSSPPTRATTI